MRDMVAQCDSNMSELQQLQVRPLPPPPRAGPAHRLRWGRGLRRRAQGGMGCSDPPCADARWPEHPALQSHTHRVGMWQAPE